MMFQIEVIKTRFYGWYWNVFEQYKNITVSLGFSGSYDDLETKTNASDTLKNRGTFSEVAEGMGLVTIEEIGHLCLQVVRS